MNGCKRLTMTDILQVQNTCGDLLEELGYKFVDNNFNFTNPINELNSNCDKDNEFIFHNLT